MEAVREGRITLELDRTVKEVLGDGKGVTGLELASTKGEADKTVDVEGVFIAIGHRPNTSLFEGKLELDRGYIVTAGTRSPAATATSVPGVFAARRRAGPDLPSGRHLRRHGLHGGARRPALPGKPTVTSIKVNPFGFITNASHQQLRRPQAGQQGPQGRGQGPRGGRKEASCRGSPQGMPKRTSSPPPWRSSASARCPRRSLPTPRLRSPVPSPSISVRARTRNPSRRCRTFSTPPSFLKPKTAA